MSHLRILPTILFLAAPAVHAQTATLSGTVTDAETASPLPGANIYVAALMHGAVAGADGLYHVGALPPGTYLVTFSFTGYRNVETTVTVEAAATAIVDVALVPGVELDPVQVTAGRHQAKALDAPASIDVITARDLVHENAPSAISALRNVTGVDMAQTGIDRHEVVLRGFNNAFSSAAYVLTDYRHAAVPALDVNLHSVLPAMPIDVARIEVVRGPGSALYGPGVTSGVIHYLSKDPFTFPGTTVSVRGGARSMLDFQGRFASVLGSKFGVKVTGTYTSARDFELEHCDPTLIAEGRLDECPNLHDAQLIALEGVRDNALRKAALNGYLEYRTGSRSSLILSGGHSRLTATVLSGIGTVQGDGFGYTWGQARFNRGSFFAQAFFNRNHGGDSYIYGSQKVVEKSKVVNLQAQYDLTLASGREQLIFGTDIEFTRPNTVGTTLGRNDDNDALNEYGVYLQSTTVLSDELDLTVATRADLDNVVGKVRFSPRAGLIYKPAPSHSFRATFNRSFSNPNANVAFLDLIVARITDPVTGTEVFIRARGAADGFTWPRDPSYLDLGAPNDLVASSLAPGFEGSPMPVGAATGDVYAVMYEGLSTLPPEELAQQLEDVLGIPVTAALVETFVGLLSPDNLNVQGFSPGKLGITNLTTQEFGSFPDDLTDLRPIRQTTSQTFEIGYKGIINDRLLLAVDGYWARKENFTGALAMETPLVLLPTLAEDLARDLATAFAGNPILSGALGLIGVTPESVAADLVTLAADTGALPTAETPVGVVQPVENNTGVGNIPELMLSYRNFGQLVYWGMDASAHLLLSESTQLFGNVSWVNDDFFDATELGEDDENITLALNAPTLKVKCGGSWTHSNGVSVNASGRFIKGFPVRSGVYVGTVDDYFILDLGLGYTFRRSLDGLRLDLGVTNALDSNHREFVGAPRLGRLAIARLTYAT